MTSAHKRKLGFWDLLGISLGQVVGGGIVILTGVGISITGQGVPWAFFLALAIVFLPSLCIAALGAAVPSTGGTYTYVRDLIGPKTAFLYLALLVAGQLVLATYAIGFAEYAAELWPSVKTAWIAGCVMAACYVANLFGVKVAARAQIFLVIILLAALLAFIGFGLPKVQYWNGFFEAENTMPDGIGAFIGAAFILRYGMIGSEFVSELGGESQNPGRNIPLVMFTCLAIVTILYVLVAIVAAGVLPIEDTKGKSLAFIAKEIFPPSLYVAFVTGGVMLALITSLNAIFAWCTKGLYMATQDGWLPKGFATTNRFGTPYIILTLFVAVGMLPIVTGLSLNYVTILGNAVGIVFGIIPALALYNLYDRNPEAWNNAGFKLSRPLMKIAPIAAFLIYAYGVYLSSKNFIKPDHIVALAIYTGIVLAYAFWRERALRDRIETFL